MGFLFSRLLGINLASTKDYKQTKRLFPSDIQTYIGFIRKIWNSAQQILRKGEFPFAWERSCVDIPDELFFEVT